MGVKLRWLWFATLLFSCATAAPEQPVVHYVPRRLPPPKPVETPVEQEQRADARVKVRGIEGTMSNFDVRVTMEERGKAFGACHEPRARRVPRMAGNIEFAIRISPEGAVTQVGVLSSDVGDRPLERCFVDVIAATPFPRPNGGEANVTWTVNLGPGRAGKDPEQWDLGRIERVVEKRGPELMESCSIPTSNALVVTAYVNRRGRVITAGVSARQGGAPELFDCVAQELRSWKMPSPRKSPLAKVSFPLGREAI
jgi:hypothetical protein